MWRLVGCKRHRGSRDASAAFAQNFDASRSDGKHAECCSHTARDGARTRQRPFRQRTAFGGKAKRASEGGHKARAVRSYVVTRRRVLSVDVWTEWCGM